MRSSPLPPPRRRANRRLLSGAAALSALVAATAVVAADLGYIAYITADVLKLYDSPGGSPRAQVFPDELAPGERIHGRQAGGWLKVIIGGEIYWIHEADVEVKKGYPTARLRTRDDKVGTVVRGIE